jgi:peroxiredoxin Q/BCP
MTPKKSSIKKKVPKKAVKKIVKKTAPKKVVKKPVRAGGKAAAPEKKKAVGTSRELRAGSVAPNFSLPSTAGGMITLSEFRGKRVVLYFYPKDMTSGCTVEAHEFSELAKTFASKKVFVFGVSPDSIESHKKFIEKDAITFPLLADVGHKAAEAYGVWVEKSMYGRAYMGIERSTFVIGPDGKLEQVYRQVKAEGHAVCVLEDLGKK